MAEQPDRNRRWPVLTESFFETSTAFLLAFADYTERALPRRQGRGVKLVRAANLRQDKALVSKFRVSDSYRQAFKHFSREEAEFRRRFRWKTYNQEMEGALENARDWLMDALSVAETADHYDHAAGLAIIALEEIGKATMAFNAANGIIPLSDFRWFSKEHVNKIESSSLPALSLDFSQDSGFSEHYKYIRILRRIRSLLASGHSVEQIRRQIRDLFNPLEDDLREVSPRFGKRRVEKLNPMEIQDFKHRAIYRGQATTYVRISEKDFDTWFELANGALNNATVAFSDPRSLSPEVLELAAEIQHRLGRDLKAAFTWLERAYLENSRSASTD